MRIKQCILSLLIGLLTLSSHAQTIQYKEKATDDYVRFFYDNNYNLVDKYCEFKEIERVASYDTVNLKFNGEFKDFDNNGRLLIQGNYVNGSKEGSFVGYHLNGQIKWKTTYVNNIPAGEWNYFYPDGKPMLSLTLSESDFRFNSFWDRYGTQKISNGEGNYEMVMPIKGFTDHGYTSYVRRGKVVNGRPDGHWTISFITDDKKPKEIPVYNEKYSNGELLTYNLTALFYDYFIPYDDFVIVPSEFFNVAEFFIINNCSFDEYSGFLKFLAKQFSASLGALKVESINDAGRFVIQYDVFKSGSPFKSSVIESPSTMPNRDIQKMSQIFQGISFFIPSIEEGKPIRDKITVTVDVQIRNQEVILDYLALQREKGK